MKVDLRRRVLWKGDEESHLTTHEAGTLAYLITHRGRDVSRDELLQEVWGYTAALTTRTVDNQILKLRKKIEDVSGPATAHSHGARNGLSLRAVSLDDALTELPTPLVIAALARVRAPRSTNGSRAARCSHGGVVAADPRPIPVGRRLASGALLDEARFVIYQQASTSFGDPWCVARVADFEEWVAAASLQRNDFETARAAWRGGWWIRRLPERRG